MVDQVEAHVVVGDPHDRLRVRGPVSSSVASSVAVAWSRWAVGSSSTSTGLVGQQRPGHREPGPLAAGDPGVAVAEPGVQAVGQRVEPVAEAGLAQRRARPRRRSPSGRASRTFSDDGGGEHVRVVVDQPDHRGVRRRGRGRRSVVAAEGHACPSAGSRKRSSRAASVVLPEPDAPDDRDPRRRARGSACTSRARGRAPRSVPPAAGPRSPAGRGRGAAGRLTVSRTAGAVLLERGQPVGGGAVRAERAPASASGRATSASASGSSTSSAMHRPGHRSPSATAGAPQQATTATTGSRRRRATAGPGGRPASAPARPRGPAESLALAMATRATAGPRPATSQLAGDLDDSHDLARQLGARRRPRRARRVCAPRRASRHAPAPAEQAVGQPIAARRAGRMQERRPRRATQRHEGEGAQRQPHPQLAVDHAVHVVDDRGEQVAAAPAEPAGRERHQRRRRPRPGAGPAAAAPRRASAVARRSAAPAGPGRRRGRRRSRPAA